MERAMTLSAKHTPVIGSRTLDIIHAAQAILMRAEAFLTFDKKQAALISRCGLANIQIS